MVSPFRGSGPFRGRGPFLGRGPWAGKAPWGFNLGGVAWTPATLFAAGEQGAWYDPSDLTTLFQDSAGTTPVTAVEQPVGLMLDKSRGIVAPYGADVVQNGNFNSDTVWAKGAGVTIAAGVASFSSVAGGAGLSQSIPSVVVNRVYRVRATISNYSSGSLVCRLSSGSFIQLGSSNGTFDAIVTAGGTSLQLLVGSGTGVFDVDDVSVRELTGNHAFNPNATTVRPVLKQENGLYYLEFGGVDDWLQTASIDFSGTDTMSVFAGVRKLSDAAIQILYELSATANSNSGTFVGIPGYAGVSSNVGAYWTAGSKGSVAAPQYAVTAATFPAPATAIQTHLSDISGDSVILRINGTQEAIKTTDQGTGNYGNYPLYIGRRGGTTLPFNGRLYSLIVRGALSDATEITNAETYVAGKTGVTL